MLTRGAVQKSLSAALLALLMTACGETSEDTPGAGRDIQPDDPIEQVNTPSVAEGDSGLSDLVFRFRSPIAQTVDYRTVNVSAAAGSDYEPNTGTLSFAAGETLTITVAVIGDTRVEASETVAIELTYANGATQRFNGTIINDDVPGLSVADASRVEGDESRAALTFSLVLDQPTLDPYPLRVRTLEGPAEPGNARAGLDFVAVDRTVVIPAGSAETEVEVEILGDRLVEPNETFELEVLDPEGQSMAIATGTIVDNDNPDFNPDLSVTLEDVSEQEGASGDTTPMVFTAQLAAPIESGEQLDMDYRVTIASDDTATLNGGSNSDLPAQSGSLTFMPGEAEKDFTIVITGDDAAELDETFTVVLDNGSGFVFATAKGTIVNDDVPGLTLTDASVQEGDDGESNNLVFTAAFDEQPPGAFTFYYSTAADADQDQNLRAEANIDYSQESFEPFTLDASSFSYDISIATRGDDDFEPDETFDLVVSSRRNTDPAFEVARATGTIVNDDSPTAELTLIGGPPAEGTGSNNQANVRASLGEGVPTLTTYFYRTFSGTGTNAAISDRDAGSPSEADFIHKEGLVQFNQGKRFSDDIISIDLIGDALIEPDESFTLRLYETESAADSDAGAFAAELDITIVNDDAIELSMTPDSSSIPEGNPDGDEQSTEKPLSALATDPSDVPKIRVAGADISEGFTVGVELADRMSTETDDLGLSSPVLEITVPAGDYYTSPQTFDVSGISINSDNLVENDESVQFAITDDTFNQTVVIPDALTRGTNTTYTLTIENDDKLLVGFDETTPTSDPENDPQNTPRLKVLSALAGDYDASGPGGDPLAVTVGLSDPGLEGNASGDDFTPQLPDTINLAQLTGGVEVLPGETFDIITVLDDALPEEDETANLTLTSASGLLEVDEATRASSYTILNDDVLTVSVAENTYEYTEGETPAEADLLGLNIAGGILPNETTLTITLGVTNGTAEAADYSVMPSVSVTIPEDDYSGAGQDFSFDPDVFVAETDDLIEETETLELTLDSVQPDSGPGDFLTFDPDDATTVNILNTNKLSVAFTQSSYDYTEGETPAPADGLGLTVAGGTLPDDLELSIGLGAVENGSAVAADYSLKSPVSLTITADDYSGAGQPVALPADAFVAEADDLIERTETLQLTLDSVQPVSGPGDYLQLDPAETTAINILNTDELSLGFAQSSYQYTEGQTPSEADGLGLSVAGGTLTNNITLSIDLEVVAGGSAATDDYSLTSPVNLTLDAGDYSGSGGLLPLDPTTLVAEADDLVENTETLQLRLASIQPASSSDDYLAFDAQATTTVELLNTNKLSVAIAETAYEYPEGSLPNKEDRIGIAVSGAELGSDPALTVELALTDVSTSPADYNADASITLTIPPDDYLSGKTLRLDGTQFSATDDGLIEDPEETLTIALNQPDSTFFETVSPDPATVTILSNDTLSVEFAEASYEYSEGNTPDEAQRIGLAVSGGILGDATPLSVNLELTDDTTEAADYNATSPITVTIPEGDYQGTGSTLRLDGAQFSATDDSIVEAKESLTLSLSAIDAADADYIELGTQTTAGVEILNTDKLEVSFIEGDYQGFENGLGNQPKLSVTGTSVIAIDIDFALLDLAAEAYPASDVTLGSLSIPPQDGTEPYTLDVIQRTDDAENDFNRLVGLELATTQSGQAYPIAPFEESFLILNDDQVRMVSGSGIDVCFDGSERIADCSDLTGAEKDYQLQDAELNQTPPQFTKDASDTTWTCETDSLTGLTWAFEQGSPTARSATEAQDTAAAADTAGSPCSVSGWRLPTLTELYNLFTFSSASGLIDTSTHFSALETTSTDYYWSSDQDVGSTGPWALSFDQGQLSQAPSTAFLMMVSADGASQLQANDSDAAYACTDLVDPLSADLTSDHRFTLQRVSGEAIVTDNLTGLTWASQPLATDASADPATDISWGTAMAHASETSYAGASDWRAPTIKELLSLLYFGCNPSGSLTDLRLPPYFAPLVDNADDPLPLMSVTPVYAATAGDALEIWSLSLDATTAILTKSEPPSDILNMQTFRVRE